MGNPHAVAFLNQPVSEVPLHDLGPLVENHDMFPERVNFEIVNVVDTSHVEARVWERGSGETMACGSGACAIAVTGKLKGLTGDEVKISLPGGELFVRWPGGCSEVVMEGLADAVSAASVFHYEAYLGLSHAINENEEGNREFLTSGKRSFGIEPFGIPNAKEDLLKRSICCRTTGY